MFWKLAVAIAAAVAASFVPVLAKFWFWILLLGVAIAFIIEGDLAAYEEAMQPIDAVEYLPHAAPSAVFLQAGELDTRPSPEDTQEAFAAASDPKKLQLYDTEHELNAQAKADARAWLLERLGAG